MFESLTPCREELELGFTELAPRFENSRKYRFRHITFKPYVVPKTSYLMVVTFEDTFGGYTAGHFAISSEETTISFGQVRVTTSGEPYRL